MNKKTFDIVRYVRVIRRERSVNNSDVTVYITSYTRMSIFKSANGRLHSVPSSRTQVPAEILYLYLPPPLKILILSQLHVFWICILLV